MKRVRICSLDLHIGGGSSYFTLWYKLENVLMYAVLDVFLAISEAKNIPGEHVPDPPRWLVIITSHRLGPSLSSLCRFTLGFRLSPVNSFLKHFARMNGTHRIYSGCSFCCQFLSNMNSVIITVCNY